jgi:HD-GYP domain-containing protein (c-di-GMP phosphodiesterase class II)
MAVADIFTALTENRPYREGMNQKQTTEILGRMAEEGFIDKEITEIAVSNYNEILENNLVAQMKIGYEFELADSVLHWFRQ